MILNALVAAPQISLPTGGDVNTLMLVRWLHFVAGILWIGLLYFFVLVNMRFVRELDPATRSRVIPTLMPRVLWWFRWGSVVTVLTGLWYWMKIVGSDGRNGVAAGLENVSTGWAINSFFLIWTMAFVVYMGVLMSPLGKNSVAVGLTAAVVVIAASWFYLSTNQNGWESNRLLAIGIGGGLGWFMLFNVWGIVWRAQKKMIRWTVEGRTDTPEFAKQARLTKMAAATNFVLSFPMLFFMGAASHYIIFVQR